MISKNSHSSLKNHRILLFIPITFVLLMMLSFTNPENKKYISGKDILQPTLKTVPTSTGNLQKSKQTTTVKGDIGSDKEVMNSHYPGGTKAWLNFVTNNLKYTDEILKSSIKGTVYVQFMVSKKGEITDLKLIRGINETCDKEVIRVVSMMPKWTPIKKNGKSMSIKYQLPVNIELEAPLPMYPQFRDEYRALIKYIDEKKHYPETARKAGVHGTVFVQMMVDKSGKISNVKILKGIGGGCDEEALRVVKEMQGWIPAQINGKKVGVMYQMLVKF